MARGNQRDKAREKNMKDQAGVVSMATSYHQWNQACTYLFPLVEKEE